MAADQGRSMVSPSLRGADFGVCQLKKLKGCRAVEPQGLGRPQKFSITAPRVPSALCGYGLTFPTSGRHFHGRRLTSPIYSCHFSKSVSAECESPLQRMGTVAGMSAFDGRCGARPRVLENQRSSLQCAAKPMIEGS